MSSFMFELMMFWLKLTLVIGLRLIHVKLCEIVLECLLIKTIIAMYIDMLLCMAIFENMQNNVKPCEVM